jgi:hypothetical protein
MMKEAGNINEDRDFFEKLIYSIGFMSGIFGTRIMH